MDQKINYKLKPELPIKYELGLHRVLPSYPTETDFVVDIIQYIIKVCEIKNKEFNPSDLKFSAKTLKYVFNENEVTHGFKDKLRIVIKNLMDAETLVKKGEFLYINKAVFNELYN
jgi:hypothetical protein